MTHGDTELISAARAEDAARVRALLEAGPDPDLEALGADGLTALEIAAALGSYPVVDALRSHGAKLDRQGPDGLTPLLRAVDAGAYAAASLLLSSSVPTWPKGPDGRTALELARHWHETGAENELRRRSGGTGAAELSRVPDDEYSFTGLLRLGVDGPQVRTGHTAILCMLEVAYGIRTPFAELLARAEAEADLEGVTRSAAVTALYGRADRETWEEAAALRGHPQSSVRHFGAEVVRCMSLFDTCDAGGAGGAGGAGETDDGGDAVAGAAAGETCVDGPACVQVLTRDLFLAWAADEPAPEVLALLLCGLPDCPATVLSDAVLADALLPHARHPSALVRRAVAMAFSRCAGEERVRPALLAYLRDTDGTVRGQACRALAERGEPRERSSDVRKALRSLLADPSVEIQIEAVRALVLLDDPRGEEALDWLTFGYQQDWPGYWSLDEAHRHLRRRREAATGAAN
ncbi:HEAT repeat domain-containing protein [Streptomyces sp. NBC_01294]|uniref:HEAT repeat domain-containing protein n=1 Tax=Streptomyces sp. NBC_01294 TaxID=2903815 RepID=UPI002DDBD12E|nr:HEAT repeat domain-containing protein [Streptomyces sp. NBC_01294]WRZ60172.1 HEAT repeat domain-containing protein [Streptomyces sp. NBC_01294]